MTGDTKSRRHLASGLKKICNNLQIAVQANSTPPRYTETSTHVDLVCGSHTWYPWSEGEKEKCKIMRQREMETYRLPLLWARGNVTGSVWHIAVRNRDWMWTHWWGTKLAKRKETMDVSTQGRWKTGDRELQRAPEVDGVETITVGKERRWHEAFGLMSRTKDMSSRWPRKWTLVGTRYLCSKLKGEYNREWRASSYRWLKQPHLIRLV